MKAMDVHCHFLPQEYVEALKRYGRISEDGFPCPQWSEEMQLEYMEKAQIAHAVLTISSPHPYFGDGAYSAQLCRMLNESAASPGTEISRYVFLCRGTAAARCGAGAGGGQICHRAGRRLRDQNCPVRRPGCIREMNGWSLCWST